MAEFLTTTGISNNLESIITETKERLVIVSPYLKVNPLLKDLLEEKDRWKIDIRVIYGKSELNPQESSWLESLTSVRTSFCENLHAKCYMNEATALITSMNLYEFSQVNNREMGILVSREGDPDLYQKIYDEVGRLLRISEEIRITIARVEGEEEQATSARRRSTQTPAPRRPAAAASQPAAAERTSDQSAKGSCIRCKATLDLDMTHAYCTRCFAQWRQKADRSAPEKYCHMCGAEHAATMNRPLCTDCYPKYMAMPGLKRFTPRNANPATRSPRG